MKLIFQQARYAYAPDVVALRAIDLTIDAGQAVAIIGANGAGKTTLVKHANGLLKPQAGRVLVGDWDTRVYSTARLARRVGLVFQNPDEQLFKSKVWDEVAFGPRNLGFGIAQTETVVRAALEQVGLTAAADQHPHDLPTDQRKLVALASVLAMQPPIIILDEPTIAQDWRGLARLGAIIADLKAAGRTVMTISHDIDFCAEHFERFVVMRQGQIVADGSAETIFAQPDLLASAGVEAPQLIRLAQAIRLPAAPTSVAAFVAALSQAAGRHGAPPSESAPP